MSIRPGARIASCKSTMRQFAGISLFARVPSLRITPSSISSRGWSIRSIGVSNVAAVSAIMKNLGVQRTERSFYRKSSISLLKHRGRNQSAEPERRTSTSHVGLSNANVIITTECVVTARFSTVCRGCSFLSSDVGEWLSLVEHLVRDQGVGGSNPLSPTNLFNHLSCLCFPCATRVQPSNPLSSDELRAEGLQLPRSDARFRIIVDSHC